MKAFAVTLLSGIAAQLGGPELGALTIAVPVVFEPVATSDGPLLAFEIVVGTRGPVVAPKVREISIVDAATGSVLARYSGAELSSRLARSDDGSDLLVYAEVIARAPPKVLEVRVRHVMNGRLNLISRRFPVAGGPPIELGPPLEDGPWVAVHHPSWERGHRRVVVAVDGRKRIPGRFAVDWVGVDGLGRITTGDRDRPSDAIGYGAPVLAGADSIVAEVRDGMPEASSIADNPAKLTGDASGNFVSLQIGPRRFAIYEHLKPGSVRVRPGQRVRSGEVIGKLGFSGDSTGPHLHMHVAECGMPSACEGVPFAVRGMTQLGRYETIDGLGGRHWDATPRRTRLKPQWPGYNAVVSFSPGPDLRSRTR